MQKAKAFMFVCTGIFLLALSYHLGARGAIAQTAGATFASNIDAHVSSEYFTCVVGRTVSYKNSRTGTVYFLPDVPGTSSIVASSGIAGGFVGAMLANGDTYITQPTVSTSWEFVGNMIAQPTPVEPSTFGSIKARYR